MRLGKRTGFMSRVTMNFSNAKGYIECNVLWTRLVVSSHSIVKDNGNRFM